MKSLPIITLGLAVTALVVALQPLSIKQRASLESVKTVYVGSDLKNLSAGAKVPDEINVVVEIPRGSQNKYELDKELGVVSLDRVLLSAVHYPGDYGIVPSTYAGDGDPLDVIVLVTEPTYPGIVIPARPIAVLQMLDGGEQDDKILAVPVNDVRYEKILDVTDLSAHTKAEISEFFRTYKNLEGKQVQVEGWQNAQAAKRVIQTALDDFELIAF